MENTEKEIIHEYGDKRELNGKIEVLQKVIYELNNVKGTKRDVINFCVKLIEELKK